MNKNAEDGQPEEDREGLPRWHRGGGLQAESGLSAGRGLRQGRGFSGDAEGWQHICEARIGAGHVHAAIPERKVRGVAGNIIHPDMGIDLP